MTALNAFGDLRNARHVTEIGCGVGRDAIALIKRLPPEGSYLGIDIIGDSIAWAQENITKNDPRMEFEHFDVHDAQHNPKGTSTMESHKIARADNSQDLVFLFSVFTHMFPKEVTLYLEEFARILRPGGRVLASMFVTDASLRAHLLEVGGGGLRKLTFEHEVEPGFYHSDPNVVPGATSYERDWLDEAAQAAGLRIETIAKGSWSFSGGHEVVGQDIVVFGKPMS